MHFSDTQLECHYRCSIGSSATLLHNGGILQLERQGYRKGERVAYGSDEESDRITADIQIL